VDPSRIQLGMRCGALLTAFLAAQYTNSTQGDPEVCPCGKAVTFPEPKQPVSDVVGEDEELNKKARLAGRAQSSERVCPACRC
jgi:hypothetical protein